MTYMHPTFIGNSARASRPFSSATRVTTVGVAILIFSISHAQSTMPPISSPVARKAPLTAPTAAEQSLPYKSVFDRYRSFRDEPLGSWRDANDTVTRVGGWREYLKEAQRTDAAPQPTPSPATAPAVIPHSHTGHGGKK